MLTDATSHLFLVATAGRTWDEPVHCQLVNVVIHNDTALQKTLQIMRENFVGNWQSGNELETIRDTKNALR